MTAKATFTLGLPKRGLLAAHARKNVGRLRIVEIPLALPTILAGVRIATVVSVGLATIAAAIGAGGLGDYIFRGLSTVDNRLILAGAIPAALLAIIADGLLGWLERVLVRSR